MSSQRITDLMQSTASENEIKFFFITTSGTIDEASEDLKYSFEIIADFASTTENLHWLSENDCLLLDASTLTKQDIFVLEAFEGKAFTHLSTTKAIVLGPRILINCQLTNDVVPNIASPMYTLAMKNNIVCLSGISEEKRAEIHKLVGFMGGLWSKNLVESTTHLITNTITSPKYEKSALRNMKIMKEDWIYEVWNLSKKDDNSYTTDEFYQKYKMPIFHNLVITSTGIPEADKILITKLINDNGGTYSGSFKSKETDILITQPNQKNSQKFKAAVKCHKECLMVDWVKDSVSKGYSLPYVNYRIYTGQPTRGNVVNSTQISNRSLRPDIFNADTSQLSAIMSDYSIAETTTSSGLTPMKKSSQKLSGNSYKGTLNNIDISLVKNAKGCLDGCTIWLCGFDGSDVEKLRKIINIGGAIRLDEHSLNVEYVIVGKPTSAEVATLKALENSNIVTVDWLVACINAKRIADPKEFHFKLQTSNSDSIQTVPSPASRKNIEAMNPFRRPDYVPRLLVLDDDEKVKNRTEKTLLEQYAQPSNVQVNVHREETGAETVEESEEIDPNLFRGLIFALFGFSEESTLELSSDIEECGGSIVHEFSKTVDYLVVPGDIYEFSDCHYKFKEKITDMWIQECLTDNKLVDIKYYHRAISLRQDCKPLLGLNIVFSTYTAPERDYLYSLARALGGEVNDRYIRNQKPILICPTPEGKKYLGAINWNLPVVSCEWLRKCHQLEKKAPMRNYAVGESKCEDDEENEIDQNVNDGSSNLGVLTQRFEKVNKIDDSGISKDLNEDVADGIREDEKNMALITPARHPRISFIKNRSSPKTPLRSNASPVGSDKTPITEFVEDLTPETRNIVYNMLKKSEENMTPLTKRRRLEKVTDSPMPANAMDPVDILDIIDSKFIEIPKGRPSTPFVEYRKRMYREGLGDKYVATPLRAPSSASTSAQLNPPSTSAQLKGDDADTDAEKKQGDGSTQIREFFNSIKKCRDSRPSPISTQQLTKSNPDDGDASSDTDEELPNAPPETEIIGYRDPEEFFQSERFLNGSGNTVQRAMVFSISLAMDVETRVLKEQIVKLGGTVCGESTAFDPTCTHLICSKPNQGEKTLSIIASGRWLLCPAYVEDSFKAGHFLNEEDYEWGNPKAKSKQPGDLDAKANKLAMVSHKWRIELQSKSKIEKKPVGVFSGFRAIIHAVAVKKDSYKRLLEAGCGVVVDLKEPYSEQKDFQGVTHCFVDKRMKDISDSDKSAMKDAGVHLVTILYLQACLQEVNLPSAKDYYAK